MKDFGVVLSENAPKPIGPYSQALECRPHRMMFLSGQIGIDPKTGEVVRGGIEEETKQVLANIESVLLAGSMGRWNVIKTTIYLTDLNDFATVNRIYGEFFGDSHRPARSTVQVAALPKGAKVEIEAIAVEM